MHPSYGGIEYYKFNITRSELLSEIEKFKELHPELNPPIDMPIFGNSEFDTNSYMAPMFFYYRNKQRVLYTVVVKTPKINQSALGFYKILDPKDRSTKNDEEINISLGLFENIKQKKLFEEKIVNPLRIQIRKKYKHYIRKN
ncbi:MAG: hypothetical protein WCR42_07080 [bacterium]